VAVLQFAGPIGAEAPRIVRPEPVSLSPRSDTIVRQLLLGATGAPVALSELRPTWYEAIWVTTPLASDEPTVDPTELSLDDDSLLFDFGAELPAELTPSLVGPTLDAQGPDLWNCVSSATRPLTADIQLVIEPGGTSLAVFVDMIEPSGAVDRATLRAMSNCLIDQLASTRFPLATGPPISLRFPLEYQPN
jgi:hypothetical protein